MSSVVNDSAVAVAAGLGVGIVVVGGIYYMLPSWTDLPSQSDIEDASASILLSPINVAAKIGSKTMKKRRTSHNKAV